jgi:citrate lyase alpha subunit
MSITCHNSKYKCWEPEKKKKKINVISTTTGTFYGQIVLSNVPINLEFRDAYIGVLKNYRGVLTNISSSTLNMKLVYKSIQGITITPYLIRGEIRTIVNNVKNVALEPGYGIGFVCTAQTSYRGIYFWEVLFSIFK